VRLLSGGSKERFTIEHPEEANDVTFAIDP